MQPSKQAKRMEVVLEFLLFGIVVGVVEDMVAVSVTTGEPITWTIFGIIVLIAIPFALIGEVFVDNVNFASFIDKYILRREHTLDPERQEELERVRREKAEEEREVIEANSLTAFNERRARKRRERKDRILEALREEGQLQNKDVANMFGVSRNTAYNYLEGLETEGKVKQVGESGRGVTYTLSD